jgi:hypothetical protein
MMISEVSDEPMHLGANVSNDRETLTAYNVYRLSDSGSTEAIISKPESDNLYTL